MWHQRGNVLLAGSGDGTAWMWLASSGTATAPQLPHSAYASSSLTDNTDPCACVRMCVCVCGGVQVSA